MAMALSPLRQMAQRSRNTLRAFEYDLNGVFFIEHLVVSLFDNQRNAAQYVLFTHEDRRSNVFVERLWRSVKYEEVYLRAYETVGEARASLGRYLDFYNGRRPHSSLDGRTPDQAYFNSLPLRLAA